MPDNCFIYVTIVAILFVVTSHVIIFLQKEAQKTFSFKKKYSTKLSAY